MSPARPNAVHEMLIIQDFARQLFDQLLADQAILMAGGAVLTLPPPYLQTYFRLAASALPGKAAADNQSLRLHCPQATVSPTAVS